MANNEPAKAEERDWSTASVVIHADKAFDFFAEEYIGLAARSEITVFQHAFWLDAIYQHLAPKIEAEPLILSVRCATTHTLLMVLPLVRQRKMTMMLLQPADLGITDYNAVIGVPDVLKALSKNVDFLNALKEQLKPFDLLLFRKQRPDSFDLAPLFNNELSISPTANSGYDVFIEQDFKTWQQVTLSKATRKGLARKKRNFDKEIGPLTFRTLYNASEIERAFTFLRQKRALRFPDDLLNRQAYFDFYLNVAKQEAKNERAVTFIGEVDGETVTVDFGLFDGSCHIMLLGAFSAEEKYKKYSLGLLPITALMHHQKARGIDHFDFAIGDEEYKRSFGAKRIPLSNLALSNSLRGSLALTVYQRSGTLKDFLKKIAPNIR